MEPSHGLDHSRQSQQSWLELRLCLSCGFYGGEQSWITDAHRDNGKRVVPSQADVSHARNFYGLGAGVGRTLGVGSARGVGVGLGVEVGVAVGVAVGVGETVGVGVGVGPCPVPKKIAV